MIEEAKEKEVQIQNKLKAVEHQVKVLTEKDQEVKSLHTTVHPHFVNCSAQTVRWS